MRSNIADTNFSIQLEGILLPNDVKKAIEAQLRATVLAEIARTDLGAEFTTKPLPRSSERMTPGTILGFVVRTAGSLAERSTASSYEPSLLYTPPDHVKKAQNVFRPFAMDLSDPNGVPPAEALAVLYYRPDIREATASVSRVLATLLSRDEQAMRTFDEITGGATRGNAGTERNPIVAGAVVAGVAFVAGAVLGYELNKAK